MSNNQLSNILGFKFSASDYTLAAELLLNVSEKKAWEKCILDLEHIANSCVVKDETIPDKLESEQVYARFSRLYKTPLRADFSSRELRMLTYSMYHIKTVPMIKALVSLLDQRWRDRFFNGLLYYTLSNWDDTADNVMELVLELIRKHLKAYKGKRDKYLILKNNMRFLSPEGPELLGLTLRQKDKGQKTACSLNNISSLVFGMSKDRLDMQFYSRVIVAYFEKDALAKLDMMERILREHNYAPTAKRLLPAIILNDSKNAREKEKEIIKTLAVSEIGDPSEKYHWKLSIGTSEEQDNLEQARQILEQWIKRKFISIFFEKCVQDPRRKKFWLNHTDMISDLDIYSTPRTKSMLLQDSRISKLVERKVIVLNDKVDSAISALGMSIDKYYFIEFSESGSGSIYIYREKIKNPLYFYQLKRPHLPTIQSFMIDKDEGKLPHLSDWEKTLTQWFRNHGML